VSLVRCDCGAWQAVDVGDDCARCGERLPKKLARYRGEEVARLKSELADARLALALRERAGSTL